MFALFGQFFDHGVDFTKKTKNYVMMPLSEDDPLYVPGGRTNFMLLSRAENQPGPDGILGTADDEQNGTNTDSPWVDQSQTYSSHSSHQVFLREYTLDENGDPVSTGELIEGEPGGMATWAHIKEQARTMLGLELSDVDVADVPKLATDQYGRFLRGPNGLPQYETATGRVEGNLAAPVAPLPTWNGSASPSWTISATTRPHSTPRPVPRCSRTMTPKSMTSTCRVLRAATTTRCWTSTSSPATAASTKTSA